MHLIQLLLPLYDNNGERFPRRSYTQVRDELVERFGGLTVYTRAPASGLWQESEGHTAHDDIVIYEVMAEQLDPLWWSRYRQQLEVRFQQQSIVARASQIQLL